MVNERGSDTKNLRELIIQGNLDVHAKEARFYDRLHGELFNWFEQCRVNSDLALVAAVTRGKRALDVGCGTGYLTLRLVGLGYQVTALDLSSEMLNVLKGKLAVLPDSSNVRLVNQDIDSFLDHTDEKYDLITFSSVLHHLPDYVGTLQKVARDVADSGGVIYIVHEPVGKPLGEIRGARALLRRLDWQIWWAIRRRRIPVPDRDWTWSDYHLYQGFDDKVVVELLLDNGYRILKYEHYSAMMQWGITNLIDNLVFRCGGQFRLIAQRQERWL